MSDPADAARWTPGSPAWVTHEAIQAENCQLRHQRDALRAALDRLVAQWDQESSAGRVYAARLAAELAARLTETP